ncbi:MAG TPA: hypothetical protein PLP19_18430 [bacterium]|nr:hypothetical protein [bacterium]
MIRLQVGPAARQDNMSCIILRPGEHPQGERKQGTSPVRDETGLG